jgi:hypothetical protein
LERHYETPAKRALRAVLDDGGRLESREEVRAFARWWVKTLLLLLHPGLEFVGPGNPLRNSRDLPDGVYQGLVKGEMPSDVSLWLALADDAKGRAHLLEHRPIYFPTIFDPEGAEARVATLLAGFSQGAPSTPTTRVLLAQLVFQKLLTQPWVLSPPG